MKPFWLCPVCGNGTPSRSRKGMWNEHLFSGSLLVTCSACGCSSIHPEPTDLEIEAFNKTYWGHREVPLCSDITLFRAQALSRLFYLRSLGPSIECFEKVLDVGAGLGFFLDALREEGLVGEYYAVEPDSRARVLLERKGAHKTYPGLASVDASAFSLIVMSHVLEHLTNPQRFLEEARNLMAPEGLFFVEVPNRDDIYKRSLGAHVIVFNSSGLELLLHRAGFDVIHSTSVGRPIEMLLPRKNVLTKFIDSLPPFLTKLLLRVGSLGRVSEDPGKTMMLEVQGTHRQWLRVVAKTQGMLDSH